MWTGVIVITPTITSWAATMAVTPVSAEQTSAFGILTFDALQLAGLLYMTGGLTNPFSLLMAVPVVVSPSVATLFLGETYWHPVAKMGGYDFVRMVNLSLTFDHRVINGVGAATT